MKVLIFQYSPAVGNEPYSIHNPTKQLWDEKMGVKEASFHFKNTLSWVCPSKRWVSSTEFEVV